jgi:GTPase SAR1 family protein
VGKTSLVLRYVENVFSDKQVATVQASYLTKRLTVDGQSVTLSIWVRFHTYPSHAFMFLGSSSRY